MSKNREYIQPLLGDVNDSERGSERGIEWGGVKDSERGIEWGGVKDSERGSERGTVKDSERGSERGDVKDSERGSERGTERECWCLIFLSSHPYKPTTN